MMLTRHALIALLAILCARPAVAQTPTATRNAGDLETAAVAWDRGDYISALEIYSRLLGSSSAAEYLEPIALQTGELYRTREITRDGRAPRISPDGRALAYETGAGDASVLRIVNLAGAASVVEVRGATDAMFSPAGGRLLFLRTTPSAELTQARAEVERTAAQTPERTRAQAMVSWLQAKNTQMIVRDLRTGTEGRIETGGLIPTTPAWSPDGMTLYFVGTREGETTRNAIYAVRFTSSNCAASGGRLTGCVAAGAPAVITTEEGFKTRPRAIAGSLLYDLPTQPAVRQPAAETESPQAGGGRGGRGGAGAGGGGGGGGGRGGAGGAPTAFAIRDLANGTVRRLAGNALAVSADGSMAAYTARSGADFQLMAVSLSGGEPILVKTSTTPIDAPALSPDGKHIVFQTMPKEDWELYVIGSDGGGERRLTREIQHDLLPRYIAPNRILAVMGEARHRRSYLYDATTLQRTRLFHNNTVRTIAPEYEWSASADGSKIIIVAERDGDTVSPERGIYVMDLNAPVTAPEVLARVRANLASEIALRDKGIATFRPIADDVRRVTEQVSVGRIYSYQKALFDFDSKHITRPGNAKAIEYLADRYASFGYEPERQWFSPSAALGGRTANVLATLRGTENPELVYIVSSHFDSRAEGPGADDNTSGTAALLEAARVMAKHPQPATIVFALFTGEEGGLLGSREWVRQAVANKVQLVGALNNDMLGWSNDHRLDNTIRYSNPGIRDIQHAAAAQFSKMITYDALYYKSTDAAAYYEAYGDIVGGIGSYPVLGNPHYHQPHDILETINHELVAEASKTTVATLMLLASSPSRLKDLKVTRVAGRTVDVAWTPSPEKGVSSYIIEVIPPSSAPGDVERAGQLPARGQEAMPRVTVTRPSATLQNVAPGSTIAVKAVNARGLEGWDWARITVGAVPPR
jgi:Tol biopolymer transport system component